MGYRIFRDSRGTDWQTYDVIPRLAERRMNERRSRVAEPVAHEKRARVDRRVSSGMRPSLTPAMNEGWLCFEARDEKRRLTPIPENWINLREAELEQLCAQAQTARRISKDFPAIDPVE